MNFNLKDTTGEKIGKLILYYTIKHKLILTRHTLLEMLVDQEYARNEKEINEVIKDVMNNGK